MVAVLASRWWKALRASVAWRGVRRTSVWRYLENRVDGRRLAIEGRHGTEALDRSFIRPGDLVWARDGMRLAAAPERPLLPWKEWRLG